MNDLDRRRGFPTRRRARWTAVAAASAAIGGWGLASILSGDINIEIIGPLVSIGTIITGGSPTIIYEGDMGLMNILPFVSPPSSAHPNEPFGFTQIGDNPLDVLNPSGWNCQNCTNLSIRDSVNLGIQSPGNVGAALFSTTLPGGSGPINLESPTFASDSLYIHFTIALSSNWDGADNNINKIFFIMNGTNNHLILTAECGGASTCHLHLGTQSVEVIGSKLFKHTGESTIPVSNEVSPTSAQAEIRRGSAREVEVLLVVNDTGVDNGQIHAWIDGVKILQYTSGNVYLKAVADDKDLNKVRWNPTYGTSGNPSPPADQFMFIDHIYISGNEPVPHTNQPAGFTPLFVENPFDVTEPSGWDCASCTNFSIKDTTLLTLQSPPNVGQVLYPDGFPGGQAPVNVLSPAFAADSVYFHFTVTYSTNFFGHTVGTKLTFIKNDTHGDTYFHAAGSGAGTLTFEVRTQGAGHPDARNYRWNDVDNEVSPSLADATLTRGSPSHVEVLLYMDSAVGAGDGQIHAWVDGTKILQFTAVDLRRPGDDDTFDGWQLNPTYGGGNQDTVPADQWIYMDHIYASGK